MRHGKSGRKLGFDSDHRKSVLRGMTMSLIEHETIRTTPGRAKELRWFAERVVTLAKRGNLAGRKRVYQLLGHTRTHANGSNRTDNAVRKLYDTLVPRFQTRPGGYTQIFRLADPRPGDNAPMCLIRYIPAEGEKKAKGKTPVKPTKKTATPKKEAKAADKPAKAAKADKGGTAPQEKATKKPKAKEAKDKE